MQHPQEGLNASLSPTTKQNRLQALRDQWQDSGELARVLAGDGEEPTSSPNDLQQQEAEVQEDPDRPLQTPETQDASRLPESVRGIAANVGKAVLRGAGEAVNETGHALQSANNALARLFGQGDEQVEEFDVINEQNLPEAQTGAYAFVEGFSQFAVGALGAGKLMKPLQWGGKAMKAARGLGASRKTQAAVARIAPVEAAGVVSDFVAFNPYEERVADLVANGPVEIAQPVGRFLQADSDDPELWARTKAAVEGGMLGIALGGTIATVAHGIRVTRATRRFKENKISEKQANAELEEARVELEQRVTEAEEREALGIWYDRGENLIEVKNIAGFESSPRHFIGEDAEGAVKAQGFDPEVHTSMFHVTTGNTGVMKAGLKASPPEEFAHGGGLGGTAEDVSTTWNREHAEAVQSQLRLRASIANDGDYGGGEGILSSFEDLSGLDFHSLVEGLEGEGDYLFRELAEALDEARGADEGAERLMLEIKADRKSFVEAMDAAEELGYDLDHFSMTKLLDTAMPNNKAVNSITELEDWDGILPEDIQIKQVIAKPDAKPRVLDTEFEIAFREEDIEVLERVQARNEQQVAAWNTLYRRQNSKIDDIPVEQIKETLSRLRTRLNEGADPTDVGIYKDLGMNLGLVSKTFDDFKAAYRSLVESSPDEIKLAHNRSSEGLGKSWDETEEGALTILTERVFGPGKTIADAERWFREELGQGDYMRVDEQIQAAHKASMIIGQDIGRVARAADVAAKGSEEAEVLEALLEDMVGSFANMQVRLGAMDSQSGRILNAKKMAGQTPEATKDLAARRTEAKKAEEILDLTPAQKREMARDLRLADGDPELIRKALMHTVRNSADKAPISRLERTISFRTNMLLSGPTTHLVNSVNNVITAFQVPLEYWWGGVRTGNAEMAQAGLDMVPKMAYVQDAFKMMRKTFSSGMNILDPSHALDEGTMRGGILGWMGSGAKYLEQLPGRALMSADEFMKQLNYRGSIRSQALRMARKDGAEQGLDGKELNDFLAQRVAERMKQAFASQKDVDAGKASRVGQGTNPWALEHSRYTTFTNDLDYGMGQRLREMSAEEPWLRFVMPFIRTPVNLVRFAWQRTPVLNKWQRQQAQDLAAGGERAAYAKARTEIGVAMYGSAITLALAGDLTGSGPSDPQLRKQWMDAGNQPYSIKLPGGKQISYRRIEPMATALQLVADFGETVGELDEESAVLGAWAMVGAMSSSMVSKTFLTGLSDFLGAIAEGDTWKVENMANNFATSFEPNALRQITNATDPIFRDARNLLDEFRARTPGFSEDLEPRRNLFGEKVMRPGMAFNRAFNPFTVMAPPEDADMRMELVNLGKALPMPSKTRLEGNLDLTDREAFDNGTGQSPYDRMLEMLGDPPWGGPPLRDQIETLVSSDAWTGGLTGGNDQFKGGSKYDVAKNIVSWYQQKAWATTLKEYPKLADEFVSLNMEKARSKVETDEQVLNP